MSSLSINTSPSVCSVVLIAAILVLSMSGQAFTFSVHPGESIQEAIEKASPGDIVKVYSGSYLEIINVTKKITLEGVDSGNGRPILDFGKNANIVTLSADGIVMEGFMIRGASNWSLAGINVISGKNIIKDNVVVNNSVGIHITSDGNLIEGNNVSNNYLGGIELTASSNNKLSRNYVNWNNHAGIELIDSKVNSLVDNNASSNLGVGIKLFRSSNNSVAGNTLYFNDFGITLSESTRNIVENNTATTNSYGIYVSYNSTQNTVKHNAAIDNDYGIYLYDSSNNLIAYNTAETND
jgi:nitrous oxidase accessory protein